MAETTEQTANEEGNQGEENAEVSLLGDEQNSEEKSSESEAGEEKAGEEKAGEEKAGGEKEDTDSKSEDGKADKDEDGAPDEYQEFSLPDGMEVDSDALEKFLPIAKEKNFSQEEAQAVVDIASDMVQKTLAQQYTAWEEKRDGWLDEGRNDPDVGGKNYDQSVADAKLAIHQIGGKELKKALDETGAGNHPAMLKAFSKLGKLLREDDFDFGSAQKEGKKDLASRLFPNHGQS